MEAKEEVSTEEDPKKEGEGEKHKGFGFVHFALEADAAKALEGLAKTKIGGRKLKGEFALRKHTKIDTANMKTLAKASAASAKPVKAKLIPAVAKPKASKLVLVTFAKTTENSKNLDETFNKKHLYKKVRKFGSVEELEFPLNGNEMMARIRYGRFEEAAEAVKKLHNHTFKGYKIAAEQEKDDSRQQTSSVKAHRLIIRNLPFSITSAKLDAQFGQFGKICEIVLPTKPNGQLKGFAFVQFEEKTAAEAAMAALNGEEIGGRAVAVDWAVGKSLYEQIVKSEQQQENGENDDEEDEEVDVEGDDEESGGADNDESEIVDVENDDEDTAGASTESEEGRTVFVRNIAFETSEEALLQKFTAQFGPVEYCKLVVDPITKASRGTAFIRFVSAALAEKAVKASAGLSQDDLAASSAASTTVNLDEGLEELKRKRTGRNFQSTIIDNDMCGLDDSNGIVLDGRALLVVLAVNREEAGQLRLQKSADTHSSDRRRLFLVQEALIRPASDAAKKFWSPADIAEREAFIKSRMKDLRINPNFVISNERLSLRHLPTALDEAQLREVMQTAVDGALQLIRGGKAAGLLSEEEGRENALKAKPRIVQVKIVRASEKDKAAAGPKDDVRIGRSKGYGFVQWSQPSHALAVLRYLTNWAPETWNKVAPEVFGRRRAAEKKKPAKGKKGAVASANTAPAVPIVEFAMDKMAVLNRKDLTFVKASSLPKKSNATSARGLKKAAKRNLSGQQPASQPPAKAAKGPAPKTQSHPQKTQQRSVTKPNRGGKGKKRN